MGTDNLVEAITALLQTVHVNARIYPHLRILTHALDDWATQLESLATSQATTIRSLYDYVNAYLQHISTTYAKPLFHDATDTTTQQRGNTQPYNVKSRDELESLCALAGFEGDELHALLSVVTFKGGEDLSSLEAAGTGKSVRSL